MLYFPYRVSFLQEEITMRTLFVPTFLSILLAAGLSSAAIAQEDQNGNSGQKVEKYQTGPFGQIEDQNKSIDNGNSGEEGQKGQTDQADQSGESNQSDENSQSGENGQSNDNAQSGETGQSSETN
jgi:hypothetical protein